jgi:hypothetical protein
MSVKPTTGYNNNNNNNKVRKRKNRNQARTKRTTTTKEVVGGGGGGGTLLLNSKITHNAAASRKRKQHEATSDNDKNNNNVARRVSARLAGVPPAFSGLLRSNGKKTTRASIAQQPEAKSRRDSASTSTPPTLSPSPSSSSDDAPAKTQITAKEAVPIVPNDPPNPPKPSKPSKPSKPEVNIEDRKPTAKPPPPAQKQQASPKPPREHQHQTSAKAAAEGPSKGTRSTTHEAQEAPEVALALLLHEYTIIHDRIEWSNARGKEFRSDISMLVLLQKTWEMAVAFESCEEKRAYENMTRSLNDLRIKWHPDKQKQQQQSASSDTSTSNEFQLLTCIKKQIDVCKRSHLLY